MNSQLFTEYISIVLLPYIDELRSNAEFAENEAVPLMDNWSIRAHSDTLQMLAEHQVKVITFPLHTGHIFQSLDVSLFGNYKKKMNDKLPLEIHETTTGLIKRIFHIMKQILVVEMAGESPESSDVPESLHMMIDSSLKKSESPKCI
jgi:hypothetical protein